MKLSDFKAGDGVLVDHYGPRPAVVLRVTATTLVLICGSTKGRSHMTEVVVRPMSPAATMLRLSAPTYFNETRVAVVTDPSAILRPNGKCPGNVFSQLLRLAAAHLPPPQATTASAPQAPVTATATSVQPPVAQVASAAPDPETAESEG